MQTILGYGGAVGRPLATALAEFTDRVRCVARTPKALPEAPGVRYEMHPADLLDAGAATAAVAGSDVVYLLVGLPYRTAVWRRDWPRLIDNVLAACAAADAKLVFLDNVYAIGTADYDGFPETAPLNPPSEKGKVRGDVLDRILAAPVPTLIARAADFYGPGIENSLLLEVVTKKLQAGRSAQWLGNPDLPHSFTYTPDAGRALARLGNDPDAYGQTWNLPTDPERRTVREWVEATAELLGVEPKLQTVPGVAWWALSLFSTDLRELRDVRAQVEGAYWLDSGKYMGRYGVGATPYKDGLRAVLGVR